MDADNTVLKRTDSLIFKISLVFAIFSILTSAICGFVTYLSQMKAYKKQCLENVRNIGDYLEKIIQDSGENFINYQEYYLEHFAEIDIPYDFNEYHTARQNYQYTFLNDNTKDFSEISDMAYASFTDEQKKAWFIYQHEYWLLLFEKARKAFDLPYTYYLVPKESEYIMIYMIDGERTHKGLDGTKSDEGDYLYLGDEYYDDPEKYKVQWRTWFTGEKQDDFEEWNNEWGHTYTHYTPLIINGRKLGLIGTEVDVADVNKGILKSTVQQAGMIIVLLLLFISFLMRFINDNYVRKLVRLESYMREFTQDKDSKIVGKIKSQSWGKNEISSLAYQFSNLIIKLEEYMKELFSTSKELNEAKIRVKEMDVLANTDSLTGVRNKNAYDSEVEHLDEMISKGFYRFGVVMIDLNYMKLINDNFGHDKGDIALKKLCEMVSALFDRSLLFRIGGDEFVVIVEDQDYDNVDLLVGAFNSNLELIKERKNLDPWEKISAAVGYAIYNKNSNETYASVFERADQAMYECKKKMKAVRRR